LKHGILQAFLEKYSTEVFDMLEGEVDMERVRAVWEAEAREEGREEGMERGTKNGRFEVLDLIEQGYSPQQVRDMFAHQQSTITVQA
jgi:predicted transposase YdaD